MSLTRKILFYFIALVVVPALFFLLLELGLRLLGTGKSYDYFHEVDINGQAYFQDNPVFIEQFYPASLDIEPLENTFSAAHDPDVLRIFVLGGSAARGFPNPEHGFGRQLEALLKDALPDRKVEVINTAMTAINSHVVYEAARSIPKGSADFAIVLVGNNEVIGPYGPGTFDENFLSNLGFIRLLQAVKRSHTGQLLATFTAGLNPRDHREELQWKGMQMFTDERVPLSDPRLATVYDHYRHNLRDTVQVLQDKGAHVILSTVPVNLRDSAPFSSVHGPAMAEAGAALWQETMDRARASLDGKNWAAAAAGFQAALAIDPDYADAHFGLALSLEQSGNFTRAAEHLHRARDLDALRFRADSQINQAIHDLAAELAPGPLTFVDAESVFAAASQPGQPGWNLFLEHVHYNFSGDYLLAREFARSVLAALGVDRHRPLPESEVARRTGYPSNMTVKVLDRVVSMVQSPPFTGQRNQQALETLITSLRQDTEEQLGTVSDQIKRREGVLQSGDGDWRLRYELAYLYEHQKDRPATYRQLYQLTSEYPHHRESLVMLARMLHQDERYRDAIPYLERALHYTRGKEEVIAQLTGWLGMAHLKLGETDLATEYLLTVPRDYPAQTHYALQAYATLIRHAKQAGDADAVADYVNDVQKYAERMIRAGEDRKYPRFYLTMYRIMRLAGEEALARSWRERQPARPTGEPAADT